MARDDLDVIAYKVLKYIDSCSKAGVTASAEKLQGVTEVKSRGRIAEAVELNGFRNSRRSSIHTMTASCVSRHNMFRRHLS